jgi:hypothetical protein
LRISKRHQPSVTSGSRQRGSLNSVLDLLITVCLCALNTQPLTLTGLLEAAKRLGKEIGVTALKRSRSVAQRIKAKHRALGAGKVCEWIGQATCIGVACAEKVADPLKQAGLLIYAINHF